MGPFWDPWGPWRVPGGSLGTSLGVPWGSSAGLGTSLGRCLELLGAAWYRPWVCMGCFEIVENPLVFIVFGDLTASQGDLWEPLGGVSDAVGGSARALGDHMGSFWDPMGDLAVPGGSLNGFLGLLKEKK